MGSSRFSLCPTENGDPELPPVHVGRHHRRDAPQGHQQRISKKHARQHFLPGRKTSSSTKFGEVKLFGKLIFASSEGLEKLQACGVVL